MVTWHGIEAACHKTEKASISKSARESGGRNGGEKRLLGGVQEGLFFVWQSGDTALLPAVALAVAPAIPFLPPFFPALSPALLGICQFCHLGFLSPVTGGPDSNAWNAKLALKTFLIYMPKSQIGAATVSNRSAPVKSQPKSLLKRLESKRAPSGRKKGF